jgi:hypothetical protein
MAYDQGGTGSVSRTVEAKLQESVSVKDFGAVGDGVADDTAAFTSAIAASKYIVLDGNDTYAIKDILLLDDTFLDGRGAKLVPVSGASFLLKADDKERVTIMNLEISDTANIITTANYCIEIDSVFRLYMEHITFDTVSGCIRLQGNTAGNSTRNGVIKDIRADGVRGIGIYIADLVHDMRFQYIFLAEQGLGGTQGISISQGLGDTPATIHGALKFADCTVLTFDDSIKMVKTHENWFHNFIADSPSINGVVIEDSDKIFFLNLWAATCGNNGITAQQSSASIPATVWLNGFYGYNNSGVDIRCGATSGSDTSEINCDGASTSVNSTTTYGYGTDSKISGIKESVTVTITAGNTTGSSIHSLGAIPSIIQMTPTSNFGADTRWFQNSLTSSNVSVGLGAALGVDATFNVFLEA